MAASKENKSKFAYFKTGPITFFQRFGIEIITSAASAYFVISLSSSSVNNTSQIMQFSTKKNKSKLINRCQRVHYTDRICAVNITVNSNRNSMMLRHLYQWIVIFRNRCLKHYLNMCGGLDYVRLKANFVVPLIKTILSIIQYPSNFKDFLTYWVISKCPCA